MYFVPHLPLLVARVAATLSALLHIFILSLKLQLEPELLVICDLCVIFPSPFFCVFGQHSSSMMPPGARILIFPSKSKQHACCLTWATPSPSPSPPTFPGENPGQTVFDEHFLIYDKGFRKIGKCSNVSGLRAPPLNGLRLSEPTGLGGIFGYILSVYTYIYFLPS